MRRFFGERQFRDRFGFRWRGGDISRLEGFSDAVFAFSIVLLIVSLEVPKTFGELLNTMKGFLSFGAGFAILLWIWHIHTVYFRRYGLQDAFTKTVNAFLLFVVLFYIYPLKFASMAVVQFMSGGENSVRLSTGEWVPIIREGDPTTMMIVYGVGVIAVFLSYSVLYWYAHRKREELRLSDLESYVTRLFLVRYLICVGVGLISIAVVLFGGDVAAALSGYSYALLVPLLGMHGFVTGSRVRKMKAQLGQGQQQRPQQRQQGQPPRPPQQQGRQQQQRHPRQRPQQQRQRQQPPQQGPQQQEQRQQPQGPRRG